MLDAEPPEPPSGEDSEVFETAGGGADRARALEMAAFTLGRIHAGGVHDHVGGGVARYSVDARWHVPHFEKMLFVLFLLLTLPLLSSLFT